MKVNHKTLTSALFALLMFSVAVSGGCGGGGSGNPVSQDTITLPDGFSSEYASPDLTLSAPEEISSNDVVVSGDSNAGDEYGDGKKINAFDLLNKTTWRIDSASIKVLDIDASDVWTDVYRDLQPRNNYNINTVTFLTSGRAMAWAKPDDKKTPIYDALTMLFKDSSGLWRNTPLLKAANFIEDSENFNYSAFPEADEKSGLGEYHEEITISPRAALLSQMLTIYSEFHYGNTNYRTTYDLHRLDNFLILDQTTWEIKDIQVYGMVRGADGSYSYGNPQNYPVTRNDYQNYKITLYTTVVDGRRVLEYRYDNAGATLGGMNKTLTVNFRDKTINQELIAPFLRFGDGFEFMQKQGNLDVIKGVLKNSDMPGDELLIVSEYGPNANLTIDNSVYYRDQNNVDYHYWVRATLAPSF